MTAAHCVDERISNDAKKFMISFGTSVIYKSSDIKSAVLIRGLKKKVHPLWKSIQTISDPKKALYDIALSQMETAAPTGYTLASIPPVDLFMSQGMDFLVYGFGMIVEPNNPKAQHLMTAKFGVSDWNYSPTHFESFPDSSSTCSGDSGGPVFIKDADGKLFVFGITSFGDSSCKQQSHLPEYQVFLIGFNNPRRRCNRDIYFSHVPSTKIAEMFIGQRWNSFEVKLIECLEKSEVGLWLPQP